MADVSTMLPPPLPGTSGTTLPPDSSTIGGGPTVPVTPVPTTTTPPVTTPTAGTTVGGGSGCGMDMPDPLTGGGSTTQVGGADGGGAPGKVVQGGGGLTGVSALSPVLTQLTDVIKSLQTVINTNVAGASGGGSTSTTAAPATSAQPAAPATTTPPASTTATANAATGAATVQGGGATAVDNTQLIAALNSVIQAITALVTILQAQVAGTSGGGAPGKTPEQTPPGKTPEQTPPSKTPDQTFPIPPATTGVGGANGGGVVQQMPTQAPEKTDVGGANGGVIQQYPTQLPTQTPPNKGPLPLPVPLQTFPIPPVTAVGGASGGPVVQQFPNQVPMKTEVGGANGGVIQQVAQWYFPPGTSVGGVSGPPEKAPEKIIDPAPAKIEPPVKIELPIPTQVGGANGGPVQQTPAQSPTQLPTQVGGANGGGAAGDVTLSNTDADYTATLTSASGDSVSIWGDPHVTVKIDGTEEKFLIGYGPGSVQLSDGSIVSWDTNPLGGAGEKLLKGFTVDSAGTAFDHTVTTGDSKDETGLTTALNDAQLREFATAIRKYEGDWQLPLKLKDTPAQK